ncbi:MAG TPA: hypothetical protein VM712_05485 [Gaiellales bacterium]|nr:hypothetical protein [Gaiellales bacterium]
METTPVDHDTAATWEAAEATAWADVYAAAPSEWAAAVGLGARWFGDTLALHWAVTGRRYFSRAIGLGVTAPATEAAVDDILALWQGLRITMCLVQSMPHCAPAAYTCWLRERGLEPFDQQDRIVRVEGAATADPVDSQRELAVERVRPETAEEWSQFLQRVYRLDTGPWLPLLVERPGWHQYVAREHGQIVAARGMYVGSDGIAWLGMDAPVPGIMTQDFAPDAAICARMVADGPSLGASTIISDIEQPSAGLDTPSYAYFGALGFSRPYTRTHWARV